MERSSRLNWRRTLSVVVLVVLLACFLWQVRSVLPPFVIAFCLAALLDPLASRLQRRGLTRGKAVATIFGVSTVAVVIAAGLLIPTVVAQVRDLAQGAGKYSSDVGGFFEHFSANADRWYADPRRRDTLQAMGIKDPPSVILKKSTGPISKAVSDMLASVQSSIAVAVGQALWLVIIPLSLFWFLLEFQRIRHWFMLLLPHDSREPFDRISQEIVEVFGAYVRGLAKVCALYALAAVLLFTMLRLNFSISLGLAAGAFYAVPYVGPLLALASAATIALAMGHGAGYVVLVIALFLVMHVAFDYGLTPRVIGGSVGLHPLLNIFALMCGATMFGMWGMLLAVPVFASAQRLITYFYPWLATGTPPDPSTASPPHETIPGTAAPD